MKKLITILVITLFFISCSKEKECWICTTEIYDLSQEGDVKIKEYNRTFYDTFEWILAYEREMTCITEEYYSPYLGINYTIRAKLITKCKKQ